MFAAEKSTIPLRGRRGLAQTFQFRRALAEAHSIPIHLEIFKKITIEDSGYHVIFMGREHPVRISTSLWIPLVASGTSTSYEINGNMAPLSWMFIIYLPHSEW